MVGVISNGKKVNVLKSILNNCSEFIKGLASSKEEIIKINIPQNILFRTQLICTYISEESDYPFELENFIMFLYLDFIKNSITRYNPKKTYINLTKEYYKRDLITISDGSETYIVDTTRTEFFEITIGMDKKDVAKGQLILDELYSLYGRKIEFDKLIESLWIGFIEEYKLGENKKAYKTILKMLKSCLY